MTTECLYHIFPHHIINGGPGSSVGIATGLRAGRSEDRIPVGARFSAPVQTGPGAHPASCTMDTSSFPGVESGRGVTLIPRPFYCRGLKQSRAIPLLSLRSLVAYKKGETYLHHKRRDFRKKKIYRTQIVFWFSLQLLSGIFLILSKDERKFIINVHQ
jgi:hypothetical protein